MKLGEIIKEYREKNHLSMSEFSKRSGISKGYVGMLESGLNPATGKPIKPSLDVIQKVASGMRTDFDTLFRQLDEDVILNTPPEDTILSQRHLELYSQLDDKQQILVDDLSEILLTPESSSDKALAMLERVTAYLKAYKTS